MNDPNDLRRRILSLERFVATQLELDDGSIFRIYYCSNHVIHYTENEVDDFTASVACPKNKQGSECNVERS